MKIYKKSLFAVFLLLLITSSKPIVYAQNNHCINELLSYIKESQSKGDNYFPEGLFPSYRQYTYRPYVLKDDDNLFFTGLIIFTLKELYPKLSAENQRIVDEINHLAIPAFERFRNKNDGHTYNFWSTQPPKIFPNSGWMNWFDKMQSLPDDFDDTSIGLLAQNADTSLVRAIHSYMQGYTNKPGKRIKNTYKRYRDIPAYSVWFGKNYPIDFDLSVACNVLYFISAYQLTWTAADSATLFLIEEMIKSGDYKKHPEYISPHYNTTTNILYHISRLMSLRPDLLTEYRQELIEETQKQFNSADNPIAKTLLSTSLKRWNIDTDYHFDNDKTGDKDCKEIVIETVHSDFVFFIADMASMLPNPLKSTIGKTKLVRFNYYCPAYNAVLLLEHLLTE